MLRICGHSVQELSHAEYFDIRKALALSTGIELEKMEGFGGSLPWPESDSEDSLISFVRRSDAVVSMLLPSEAMFLGYRLQAEMSKLPLETGLRHTISLIADNLITSGISDARVFLEPRFVQP